MNREFKFIIAGCINSAFGFLVFWFAITFGAETWEALLCSNIAGIGFNYLTIGGAVFRDMSWSNFIKFVSAYLILLVLNVQSIKMLMSVVDINLVFAQAILTGPMATFSYITMRFWVFPNRKSNRKVSLSKSGFE